MYPISARDWRRRALAALALSALLLAAWVSPCRKRPTGPPVVGVDSLVGDELAWVGQEVIVTGEWVLSAPSGERLRVVLRGRDGARVGCLFDEVSAPARAELDMRLLRRGVVAIRGRFAGVSDGEALLRGCCLLD